MNTKENRQCLVLSDVADILADHTVRMMELTPATAANQLMKTLTYVVG